MSNGYRGENYLTPSKVRDYDRLEATDEERDEAMFWKMKEYGMRPWDSERIKGRRESGPIISPSDRQYGDEKGPIDNWLTERASEVRDWWKETDRGEKDFRDWEMEDRDLDPTRGRSFRGREKGEPEDEVVSGTSALTAEDDDFFNFNLTDDQKEDLWDVGTKFVQDQITGDAMAKLAATDTMISRMLTGTGKSELPKRYDPYTGWREAQERRKKEKKSKEFLELFKGYLGKGKPKSGREFPVDIPELERPKYKYGTEEDYRQMESGRKAGIGGEEDMDYDGAIDRWAGSVKAKGGEEDEYYGGEEDRYFAQAKAPFDAENRARPEFAPLREDIGGEEDHADGKDRDPNLIDVYVPGKGFVTIDRRDGLREKEEDQNIQEGSDLMLDFLSETAEGGRPELLPAPRNVQIMSRGRPAGSDESVLTRPDKHIARWVEGLRGSGKRARPGTEPGTDPQPGPGDLPGSFDKVADALLLSKIYDKFQPEKQERRLSEEELMFEERKVAAQEAAVEAQQASNYRNMLKDRWERLFPEKYARR